MSILFSICITSYNRVKELERMLKSVDSVKYKDSIEIVVSEDKSPKKELIKEVVEDYKKATPYKVVFNTNENNLGYDRNLGKLKSLASGKFIIYMSDDDMFNPQQLDLYLDYILEHDCDMAFQPFTDIPGYKREYSQSFFIKPSEANVAKHIDDAILFSGLTFKKEKIEDLNSEPFLNSYYFQVYMFMTTLYKWGGHFINIPLVSCVGDGENGYGLSDSSVKSELLADRKSIYSKLEFNRGLIKVIGIFDDENKTKVKDLYAREYTIHLLPDMCKARVMGKDAYKKLLDMQESLDIKLTFEYSVYKIFIALFGGKLTMKLFSIPKYLLLNYRKHFKR